MTHVNATTNVTAILSHYNLKINAKPTSGLQATGISSGGK